MTNSFVVCCSRNLKYCQRQCFSKVKLCFSRSEAKANLFLGNNSCYLKVKLSCSSKLNKVIVYKVLVVKAIVLQCLVCTGTIDQKYRKQLSIKIWSRRNKLEQQRNALSSSKSRTSCCLNIACAITFSLTFLVQSCYFSLCYSVKIFLVIFILLALFYRGQIAKVCK